MRALLQRVNEAQVTVDSQLIGRIERGFCILLGIKTGDGIPEVEALAKKIVGLRVFSDKDGRFNHAITDIHGSFLVVSQFTLYADTSRGRRPSFSDAAPPDVAKELYEAFMHHLHELSGLTVAGGQFGAHMHVSLTNDGPVTIMLDTEEMR